MDLRRWRGGAARQQRYLRNALIGGLFFFFFFLCVEANWGLQKAPSPSPPPAFRCTLTQSPGKSRKSILLLFIIAVDTLLPPFHWGSLLSYTLHLPCGARKANIPRCVPSGNRRRPTPAGHRPPCDVDLTVSLSRGNTPLAPVKGCFHLLPGSDGGGRKGSWKGMNGGFAVPSASWRGEKKLMPESRLGGGEDD